MSTIRHEQAGQHLQAEVTGYPRSAGATKHRTIEELLQEAEAAEGVYGANCAPVSERMTIQDLLDWHAGHNWEIDAEA